MPNRSHITQEMQNYYDYTDVRSRNSPVSLEAQLLNLAGFELEDLIQRVNRELAQTLQTVPTNVDNGGVYYSSSLPNSLLPAAGVTTFTSVVGLLNNSPVTVTPYNDTLPVPSRIVTESNPVPFTNPLMFTVIGTAYAPNGPANIPLVQYTAPGTFPIPNKLIVWIDEIGRSLVNVTLTITGEIFPAAPWIQEQKITTEVLTMNQQGFATTLNRWSSISKIAIRNLSPGMRLRGYSMPFNLYATPDTARFYTSPEDRYTRFKRFWKIDNESGLLLELYQVGLLTGFEPINSYALPNAMVDVAVEPNTYGMFLASTNKIYYVDRREYQAPLAGTGLTVEPLYGLKVCYDITKTGPTRYVSLSATPYANSANIAQYRYVLNNTYTILPSGALGPLNAGWRIGAPQTVSFPLTNNGNYSFQLQMQDNNGTITYDIVPFLNAVLIPLKIIDMSTAIDKIVGMAYDSYGQLWIWNGSFAIPLDIHYDGYIYDPDNTTIYVTEPYTSLQITL